jgi:hypothetical protein
VGGGAYPLPNHELETGEDLGFHGFIGFQSNKDHALSTMLAYQKTWHQSDMDRDLVLARVNVRPTSAVRLYGSVKADIHTSDDTLEDSSVEISQAWFQAHIVPDNKKGLTLSYSHYSWPELLRDEYQSLPDDLISDGYVERGSVSGWVRIRDHFRVSVRGNVWFDQDNTGGGGEAGFDWTDIKNHGTSLYSAVSYTQGTFNNGIGGRMEVRQRVKSLDVYGGYQVFQYQQDSIISGSQDFVRHTARAGLGWTHGTWYHSVNSDYYFGDGENSVSLMFYTEWRF